MLTPINREMWRVNKYIWFSLGFVLLWYWLRSSEFDPAVRSELAWVMFLGISSVGLRTFIAYRSGSGTSGQWGYVLSSVDIVLIAAAVRMTGGLRSDLWLLYLLLVVTETLNVFAKGELFLTALTFAAYGAAVWPVPDAVTFCTRLFFMYIVSAIARRLYKNFTDRSRQLAAAREQLMVAEEKSRVARELHDGLGREIVNVILGLEVTRRVSQKNPEQVSELLEENITLLRTAMNDTRDLIFQTRPWPTEGDGCDTLGERVERYARQFADRTEIEVHVTCELEGVTLAPQAAYTLLRIVQEALNNIAKHAAAHHVSIGIRCVQNHVIATVADDGVGFSSTQVISDGKSGIGLQSMRERAQGLGGDVEITSIAAQGTRVIARIPLA